jgi:hypothetical protein
MSKLRIKAMLEDELIIERAIDNTCYYVKNTEYWIKRLQLESHDKDYLGYFYDSTHDSYCVAFSFDRKELLVDRTFFLAKVGFPVLLGEEC